MHIVGVPLEQETHAACCITAIKDTLTDKAGLCTTLTLVTCLKAVSRDTDATRDSSNEDFPALHEVGACKITLAFLSGCFWHLFQ